jgi:hypothetical protein
MNVRREPRGSRDNLHRLRFRMVEFRGKAERITSEYLVASLAAQDHLDTHGLDLAAEEVHWRACSHGRHVVRFQMVYYVWNGVQAFLHGEYVFVVHGAQIVSCFPCGEQVRGILQADRK